MNMPKSPGEVFLVVFSDLDGTLLDHHTYRFDDAEEALQILRKRQFPLVLVSSKTRAELGEWTRKLETTAPFIVENGGAIFVPRNRFASRIEGARSVGDYWVVELGLSREKLIDALKTLNKRTGLPLRGFHEMSVEEVLGLTSLTLEQAERAMEREYSELFILMANDRNLANLKPAVYQLGLQITTGGRFHHLMGGNDKGKAVRIVTELFQREHPHRDLLTAGVGDSPNDIPMLNAVTYPVVVQRGDGTFMREHLPANTILAGGRGPAGWREGIFKILEVLDRAGEVLKPSR